jgi:hypothetical protein
MAVMSPGEVLLGLLPVRPLRWRKKITRDRHLPELCLLYQQLVWCGAGECASHLHALRLYAARDLARNC